MQRVHATRAARLPALPAALNRDVCDTRIAITRAGAPVEVSDEGADVSRAVLLPALAAALPNVVYIPACPPKVVNTGS